MRGGGGKDEEEEEEKEKEEKKEQEKKEEAEEEKEEEVEGGGGRRLTLRGIVLAFLKNDQASTLLWFHLCRRAFKFLLTSRGNNSHSRL